MRKIKFRAWDYEDKKMWKVVSISSSIWGDCEEAHIKVCEFDKSPRDKETDVRLSVSFDLMQYTGLKDINGREIYEGDIVNWFKYNASIVKIDKFGPYLIEEKFGKIYFLNVDGYCEVIGNIYENPELLEGME